MKTCTECKKTKDLPEFWKQKGGKFGLGSKCIVCLKLIQKIRFQKNPENVRNNWRKYERNNTEKVKAKNRRVKAKARLERPDEMKAIKKRSYAKTKEKILKRNAIYVNKRKQIDVNFRLSLCLRARLCDAIRNKRKTGSAVKDLGCSLDFFKQYIESKFQPGMTWENWGSNHEKWQLDHIKPLFSFDLTKREEFLQACHYTNLQPIWYTDHLAKSVDDRRKYQHVNS